jgi:hypothetical protein
MISSSCLIRPEYLLLGPTQKYKYAPRFCVVYDPRTTLWAGTPTVMPIKFPLSLLLQGSCEHGDEPSGSIKCWEVLEWLHNWRFLKKGSAP